MALKPVLPGGFVDVPAGGGGVSGLTQHAGVYGNSATTLASSGTLYASSYSSFAAAITAIGSTQATLVVDSVMSVTGNVTVPATCALKFEGLGQLNISSSQVVTINGNLSASIMQIFAGSGTVTFSASTPITTFYPQWWGVTGAGAVDETAPMQAALNAMQSGFRMVLTPGFQLKDTGLTIYSLNNFTLEGLGGSTGDDTAGTPKLTYIGTDGGVHINMGRDRGCVLRNLYLNDYGGSTHGPDSSIWLNMQNTDSSNLSSDNRIEDVNINGPSRSTWAGIYIYESTDNNNEWHRITHCNITATNSSFGSYVGRGIYIRGSQPKQILVERCSIHNVQYCIDLTGGSFRSTNNRNGICQAIYHGTFTDPCYSFGEDSEGATQVVVASAAGGFTLAGGRFDGIAGGQTATVNSTADPVISTTGGQFTVIGNAFAANNDIGVTGFSSGWIADNGSSTITFTANAVGTPSAGFMSGLDTFLASQRDQNPNGKQAFAIRDTLWLHQDLITSGGSPVVGLVQGQSGVYKFSGGGTLTNFVPGVGQTFPSGTAMWIIGNGSMVIANGASITTVTGSNITLASGEGTFFYLDGTVWRQIGPTGIGSNAYTSTSYVPLNGALGTPTSGTATNLSGTAAGLTAGNVTTNANLTGPVTSTGNATSVSQTGTGSTFVMDTSPTLKGTVTLPTGTTTVGPINLPAGTNLTSPVNGTLENNGTHVYFTLGGTRYQLDQQSAGASLTIGSSAISGGSGSTKVLYDNSGTLGETAGPTFTSPITTDRWIIGANSSSGWGIRNDGTVLGQIQGTAVLGNAGGYAAIGAAQFIAGSNGYIINSGSAPNGGALSLSYNSSGVAEINNATVGTFRDLKVRNLISSGTAPVVGSPSYIVATGRVTAQSAANASIATFTTPASDGSYEVSMNMNVTAATVLSTTLTCNYTDESNTARTLIFPTTSLSGSFLAGGTITATGAFETPVIHIRCKASTSITLYTATGTFNTVTYTAEGIIKQTQ